MEPIWLWMAAVAALVIVAVSAYAWSRSRSPLGRQRRLAERVARVKRRRNNSETFELLRQIYGLAHASVAAGDGAGAYQAIDLLKTVFGNGIARPDEPQLLAALAVRAVQAKQPEAAAAALDAFRLLLKHLTSAEVPSAAEQLTNIAAVAIREKHNFLAAKAAEIIFGLLERIDWEKDQASAKAAIRVLKTVGILALRRRDADLFREIAVRLSAVAPPRVAGEPAAELVALTGAWLHRIIQNDDEAMYAILAEYVSRQGEKALWPDDDLAALVKEWHNLAGTASLRPHSRLAPAITELALRLSLAREDDKRWEAAVAGAGQTVRMAIQRHGLKDGFPLVLPLLEIGRELLALELKFGSVENAAHFRQQALYLVVRECLALAQFIARQDMVTTAGDVIADFFRCWSGAGRANSKAARRFCQLLAAYWLRTRGRQAKRTAISEELATPVLLKDADKQRLGFLS